MALLTTVSAPAAARAASSGEYFGTNLQTLSEARTDKGAFFQALADQRMTVNRIQLEWRLIEPAGPFNGGSHVYDWGTVEPLVEGLAQRGLRLAPLFRRSPSWAWQADATKPNGFDEMPAASYDDYGLMIAAYARRFGPGGTFWQEHPGLPARPTLSYEIWNEANLNEYAWNHQVDPVGYSELLKVIRPIIKGAQPDALLLGSMAWQSKASDGVGVYPGYVAALAAAGGLSQLDAMGFHPYAPDAQAIFDLVRALAADLAAAGRPNFPIFANENGWPVHYGDPGQQYANQGFTSDASRGATLAFAGEALALSDCNVQQFLPWSVIATENPLDPNNEGFMGLFDPDRAQPNLTAQALGRASARWMSRVSGGGPAPGERLALCSGGASPAGSLLPIQATFTGSTTPGCVTVHATYDGNPLESAYLRLGRDGGPELASARTDARGDASACVEPMLLDKPFTATADLRNAGTSGSVRCDVPTVGCPAGVAMTPAVGESISAWRALGRAGTPPEDHNDCEWALTASRRSSKVRRGGTVRVKLRARVDCTTRKPGTIVRFVMSAKRKSGKRENRIRSVYLKTGVQSDITVERPFRKSDVLVLLHRADPGTGIPRIRTTLTVSAPKKKR